MSVKLFFKAVFLLAFVSVSLPVSANFYDKAPEGFLWYKDHPPLGKKKREEKAEPSVSIIARGREARKRNEARKERLEAAIQIALDDPTLENTRRAQREQKKVFDHSENFAKSWTLAAVLEGIIDAKKNANSLALQVQRKAEKREQKRKLKALSKHWGLAVFVKEGCVHCRRFAPILERFAKKSGFQVLAISKEGHDFGPFEGRPDRGFFDSINPDRESPVLFLMHQSGKRVVPVARGITDIETLSQNILSVVDYHKKKGVVS